MGLRVRRSATPISSGRSRKRPSCFYDKIPRAKNISLDPRLAGGLVTLIDCLVQSAIVLVSPTADTFRRRFKALVSIDSTPHREGGFEKFEFVRVLIALVK